MKKHLGLFFVLAIISVSLFSQNVPVYPIPSFNVPITGIASFIPSHGENLALSGSTREKRSQNITIHGATGSYAIVWIYSLDGLDVLGPYTVYAGETLSVPIDDREWGVIIQTSFEIQVDVWVSGG